MKKLLSPIKIPGVPSEKRRHFLSNLIVGFIIILLFFWIEPTGFGEYLTNIAFDCLLQWDAESPEEEAISPVVFVNISRDTYAKWGMPLLTPRDELARIVQLAYENEANVIILDISFEDPDYSNRRGDQSLRAILTTIRKNPRDTKVIIPVSFSSYGQLRPTIVDDLIDEKTLFRAESSTRAPSTDFVYRYWAAYEIGDKNGCLTDCKIVVWGMPLMAAALYSNQEKTLLNKERDILVGVKELGSPLSHELTKKPGIDGKSILFSSDTEERYLQRIRFFLVPGKNVLSSERELTFLLTPKDSSEQEEFRKFFHGKIVIIGNSSPDANDIIATPLGHMAGMYLIGNAVLTVVKHKQPRHVPWGITFMIEFIVAIFAAYCFLYFRPILAHFITVGVIIVVLGAASVFVFFQFESFLNVMFPAVGMSLHRIAAQIEEALKPRRRKDSVVDVTDSEKDADNLVRNEEEQITVALDIVQPEEKIERQLPKSDN
jgi:hypothetical protein